MLIANMRTNHVINPLGYTIDKPVFTWTVEETAAKKQKCARVVVCADADMTKTLFDSGEREDISNLGFVPEMTLEPYTRYYWQVSVTGDNGETATGETAWFETAKMQSPWEAEWIGSPFEKSVHPVMAKTFTLTEKPVSARVYAVGLGLYELTLNGGKVGDEVLTPFYNDYNLWVQYQTYDITDMLAVGENRIDAMLGNGWYKGRFGFVPDMHELYGDQMKLLAEIRLTMADGSVKVIGTDKTWQCVPSPVLSSSIYNGEVYDARIDTEDLSKAIPPVDTPAPKGKLMARRSVGLRRLDSMPVKELIHTPADEWVLDFGQLMTGWVEFDCDLPEGAEVLLEHGELLQHDNFYTENLRTAKEQFRYISNGKPAHVRPHFTFYGFRFVKVTGLDTIDITKFVGRVIHSDIDVLGKIETSNAKVNKLIQNAFWGQIGNFVDVPTDCPQRDERMGWTGDAHVFAPTASFNMYTPAFYDKFLYDMLLEQRVLKGAVPHVVPDVLDQIESIMKGIPFEDGKANASCAWADVATAMPWTLYTFYGDKTMLARHYENMKLWTDWIYNEDETNCGGRRLWNSGFHFADWLALDNPEQGSSFGGTDPYYIATCYYFYSATMTAKAAEALGYEEDARKYFALAEEVKAAYRSEFFTANGRIAEPTQTAMIMSLFLGLAPEGARERIKSDLRKKIEQRNMHLDTGFVGTYYICRTLTQNGMGDIAYTLLLNEDFPSWLYEVNMGATTVWERWNSVLPNGLVSDTGMNSMNHYAYGSVVEWMYRYMCGINPTEEAPGFKKVVISTVTDPRFDYAHAEYASASGLYRSGWKKIDGGIEYNVTVPFDSEAAFVPERKDGNWTVDGQPMDAEKGAVLETGDHVVIYRA